MTKHAELDKFLAVRNDSKKIHDFLTWLKFDKDIYLCTGKGSNFLPLTEDINTLLAEYYNIDLHMVHRQKDEIIRDIRRKVS